MSTPSEFPQVAGLPNRGLLPSELAQFFTDRNVSVTCERCKTSGWSLLSEAGPTGETLRGTLIMYPYVENDIVNQRIFNTVVLTCRNCGNIWQINRFVIEEWLRERDGAVASQDQGA